MEYLDIVDLNDNVVGKMDRKEVYKKCKPIRIVSLFIKNSKWEIALQKRSSSVWFLPWYLWFPAWWHVASWETYEQAIKREMVEEIWINTDFKLKFKRVENIKELYDWKEWFEKDHFIFHSLFETTYDGEFNFNDWEVESIRYYSKEELSKMIENWEKIMPWVIKILKEFYL